MAHSRLLALLSPFTATPVGYRASEAPSAEHRAASNQRAACSTSRPLHGQRSSACLPRQPSAPQTATLASAHRQPASACVVHSVQSPVLVPVREISEREELRPLPRAVENVADDTTLHNPLARQSRFSPGWMGVRHADTALWRLHTSAICRGGSAEVTQTMHKACGVYCQSLPSHAGRAIASRNSQLSQAEVLPYNF